MRNRSRGLTLFGAMALFVAACSGGGATASPSAATTPEPSAPASVEPSAPASVAPSGATSDLKIGVVTDIGTLNDKNFNEYSFKGAQEGAAAIGAPEPVSIVPTSDAEYASSIQSLIDQDFDVIVTVGFNLASSTVQAAHDNPDVWFVGFDQSPICVTAEGLPDPNFECAGDAKTLLPQYVSLGFAEDQAGYLAGIVAGGATKTNEIGAIIGTSLCGPCIRYAQGFELGAKSVNPEVTMTTAYVTNDFSAAAFQDQAGGKTFADNFLAQNPNIDVLFQIAGLTGNGVLDSACAKGIYGVGVDVDQYLSYPNAAPCLLTSAEKNLQLAISTAIQDIAAGTATPGDNRWDATNDGIATSEGHDLASEWAPDTQAKLDEALAAMKAGTLTTCPENCGSAQ
jgi:basic membrane protein A